MPKQQTEIIRCSLKPGEEIADINEIEILDDTILTRMAALYFFARLSPLQLHWFFFFKMINKRPPVFLHYGTGN